MTQVEADLYAQETRDALVAGELARELFPPQARPGPRLIYSTTPTGGDSWFRAQTLAPAPSEAIVDAFREQRSLFFPLPVIG